MKPSLLIILLLTGLIFVMAASACLFAQGDPSDAMKLAVHTVVPASSATFNGSVTDRQTGRTVGGAVATLLDTGGAASTLSWGNLPQSLNATATRTDPYGRFSFQGVHAAYGTLLLEKEGYGRVARVDVDLRKPLRLSMDKAATIRGTAMDSSGRPIADARITVESLTGRVRFGSTKSGSDGSFAFDNLAPDTYVVQQQEGDLYTRIHCAQVSAGQDYTVDWSSPGKATVKGRVTLRSKPVPGAHVIAHPLGGAMYVGFCDTDDKGQYTISIPEPGKYLFTSYQGEWTDPDRIYVRSVVTVKPGVNRFEMQFPGAALTGVVVDAKSGRPVPNLALRLLHRRTEQDTFGSYDWFSQHVRPVWWPENLAQTDAMGRFSIDNVAGGQWLLTAQLDSLHAVPLAAPIWTRQDRNKKSPVCKLPQLGSAELTVADAKTGKLPPNTSVSCVDAVGVIYYPRETDSKILLNRSTSKMENAARFVFDKLAPGHYRAVTKSVTHLTSSLPFDVKPGKATRVNVKMTQGQRIVFSLKETEGDLMPGLPWVGYRLTKVGRATPVLEDAQGPYWGEAMFLRGNSPRSGGVPVPPGRYMLKAVLRRENAPGIISAHDDLWSTVRTISVLPGKDLVIEIPWSR